MISTCREGEDSLRIFITSYASLLDKLFCAIRDSVKAFMNLLYLLSFGILSILSGFSDNFLLYISNYLNGGSGTFSGNLGGGGSID